MLRAQGERIRQRFQVKKATRGRQGTKTIRETDTATNNVKNEKVRVKAELRSRISHLELEEEKEKQALASEV